MCLQGKSRKQQRTVSFSSPRRNSHEGTVSRDLPDAEAASALRSGVVSLKQSLNNAAASNAGEFLNGILAFA